MSTGYTFYGGDHTRAILPIGLIKHYNLDVKIVEEPQDVQAYKKLFPLNKFPAIVGPNDYKLHEVIAVIEYLISLKKDEMGSLLGENELEYFQILKWLSYGTSDFVFALVPAFLMIKGRYPYHEYYFNSSYENLNSQVEYIESELKDKKYLINDKLTLADLFMATMFLRPFAFMYGDKFREEHPVLMSWWNDVIQHPILNWFEFPLTKDPIKPTDA